MALPGLLLGYLVIPAPTNKKSLLGRERLHRTLECTENCDVNWTVLRLHLYAQPRFIKTQRPTTSQNIDTSICAGRRALCHPAISLEHCVYQSGEIMTRKSDLDVGNDLIMSQLGKIDHFGHTLIRNCGGHLFLELINRHVKSRVWLARKYRGNPSFRIITCNVADCHEGAERI